MAEAAPTTASGRVLGRRGAETRQRILDTIASTIATRGVRELRLSEVTREVGVSPPAFYQYFRDLDEALLALSEQVGEHLSDVKISLEIPWEDGNARDLAVAFVSAFTSYWDDNRPVLWVRNVAAQDGDDRFRAIRNRSLEPLVASLSSQIAHGQAIGRIDPSLSPTALATTLMMLLERMGMMHDAVVWLGVERDELIHSVAYVFERCLIGSSN